MISIDPLLKEARAAGVKHEGNLPFLLRPQTANGRAALLIHGFSASPREMRPLAEKLTRQGYLALGVRLAGHGTRPQDLQSCRWQDWYRSAYCGYEILAGSELPVDLVAQSTGTLIGLELALRKSFGRAVLLSPYLRLRHPLARFSGWLKYFVPFQTREIEPCNAPFYYARRPLAAIEQILLLAADIKPQLSQLEVPVLVLNAQADQTVNSASGRELYYLLGSSEKRLYQLAPPAPHDLASADNPCFNEVWDQAHDFLTDNLPVKP